MIVIIVLAILIAALVLFVLGFVTLSFASASLYLLRRRGHPEFWKASLVAFCIVAAPGGISVLVWELDGGGAGAALLASGFFLGVFILATMVAWSVARVIPYRSIRLAGRRPRLHRYGWWAAAWLVLAAVIITLQWPTARAAFYIGSLLFYMRAFYLNWERRTRAPDLYSAVSADNRPPVLYLRSFTAEDKTTLWRPKRRKGRASWVAAMGRWLASNIAPQVQSVYLTLEQYISRHVTTWIGPLVALGNPEDRLAPEGAARAYVADTEWKTDFTRHVLTAQAVIIEPGPTPSLAWELRALRERGLATKVFLILEPGLTVPFGLRSYARLTWRLRGWKLPSWQDVATQLRDTGYVPPDQDPGPGSVITFDEQGRSSVLAAGARSPDALIRPIRQRLYPADGEVAVPDRPSHVLREAALVMTALIACTLGAAGARQLLPHGSSPIPVAAPAAAAEPAPEITPATTDPHAAEASQLAAINELVQQSAHARSTVVAATHAIQACAGPDSVSQAIQQLQHAATIRQSLMSQLTQQPVDQIPDGNELASDLAEALDASARSDKYYAAWGNEILQTADCNTASQNYQAAQISDQEATNAKLTFAQMWDQEAPQFGLPQLGQGQF